MRAYYAKKSPIPPPIITPSSSMPNPQEFFLHEDFSLPKKQGHDQSSCSTSTLPQAFEIGESSCKTSLERHEEKIEGILNHLEELSLDRIKHIEDKIEDLENVRPMGLCVLHHLVIQKVVFVPSVETSYDSNVVNAPQEPVVFNQEPREDSSQSTSQIDHQCCYGYGDPLDGVFCQQCTCESCGNGAHICDNCPPKVLVVSNPKLCQNQNVDELPQTLTNFHPTSYTRDENSSAHDSTPNFVNDSPNVFHPPPKFERFSFFKTPKVLLLAWDRVSEIKNAVGNKQYKSDDVQELLCKLLNDVQNIHEELANYINIPSWNCPTFFSHDDDDENYTIAITLEEHDNSLSMGDEHLDTIPATELDKVIKSSFEDLIPIPCEYEGILDNACDVHFRDNSPPLNVSKNQFKEFSDSTDESISIDDDYFSIDNINYIYTTTHADYSLSKYDSFLFAIEPDQGELFSVVILAEPRVHVPNVLTTHPTLMLDSNFIPSDNSLLESEIFYFNIEEKNSGSTTIHADISLSDLECFNFKREPEPGELTSIVDSRIHENVLSTTNENLPPEDDHSPLFAYVVWIFLSFPTYPVVPPNVLSFENEDTIFDHGISNDHSSSFMPGVSHRCGTFMKFNIYPNHLNESPMDILSSTTFPKDQ
uniref:Uncharacterized protein n=1 Tax=Tanacetum cinerariifolium TaxID=118510 RepID=A0A699GSL3_TANCI|nr:hypothetical protein [Tanacetum cinerariifolium]